MDSPTNPGKDSQYYKGFGFVDRKRQRPISIVEDEGLENLIRVFTGNSSFSLPSRSTIKSRVDSFFVDLKEDIQQDLCHADYTDFTCDYWSSLSNENYLGMTAHYIDAAFKLQSYALEVSYSEDTLQKMLLSILSK